MNKIIYAILTFCFTQTLTLANLHDVYISDINFDWINKPEATKESLVNEVKEIVFKNNNYEKQDNFKDQFKEILKDKKYKEHYLVASAGYKERGVYNISAFYYKKQKNIYMYALQKKDELSKIYYYSALGKLRYVDFIEGKYPNYPYYSIQYKINGEPLSITYFASNDNQYVFNPDGTFRGLWYKHNMYDLRSNIIETRTFY